MPLRGYSTIAAISRPGGKAISSSQVGIASPRWAQYIAPLQERRGLQWQIFVLYQQSNSYTLIYKFMYLVLTVEPVDMWKKGGRSHIWSDGCAQAQI
jgi:hypothetical protein